MMGMAARGWRSAHRLVLCFSAAPRLTAELLAWRVSLPFAKRALTVQTLARIMWAGSRSAQKPDVERIAGFLGQGGRWLVSGNCVERSLVLYRLLSRAGADPALVLGMRPGTARAAGHAWVEVGGRPLADVETASYHRLMAIGAAGQLIDADAR